MAPWRDPHLYKVAEHIAAGMGVEPGDRYYGQLIACIGVDIEAVAYSSRTAACAANRRALRDWQDKRKYALKYGGVRIPAEPPTEDTVRRWASRFVQRRDVEFYKNQAVPAPLQGLIDTWIGLAAERARELGHFTPGEANLAAPQPRHMLFADGYQIKRVNDVRPVKRPDGRVVNKGSRAKKTSKESGGPRLVDAVHPEGADQPFFYGHKYVVALTQTQDGPLVLGLDRCSGRSEADVATALIARIAGHLGDGLHAVAYDRALNGHHREQLIGDLGLCQVSTHAPARRVHELEDEAREQAQQIARQATGTTRGPRTQRLTQVLTQDQLKARAKHASDGELLTGVGLPLGLCQYPRGNDAVHVVASVYNRLGTVSHRLPDGTDCRHTLWEDDGALWETASTGREEIKTQQVTCRRADRLRVGNRRVLKAVWELRCAHAGADLTFATTFDATLHGKQAREKLRGEELAKARALSRLQPLSRSDKGFARIDSLRNAVESFFSWYEDLLHNKYKRSGTLSANEELLKFLWGAILRNALTLEASSLAGRTTETTAA